MRWHRAVTFGGLAIALAALAAWQWREYRHECSAARETVANSADSVMNVLIGGVQSHRRLGQFFAENMQDVLEGLTQSRDVLAAALVSEDGKSSLSAGETQLLNLQPPLLAGGQWDDAGFRCVSLFRLPSEGGREETGGLGAGHGRGRWRQQEEEVSRSFLPGSMAAAILLLRRDRADEACRHAAQMRGSIAAAGSLLVLCVAFAWSVSMKLAESRGRARLLEIEARHWRDLSQAAAGLAHETRNPLGLIRGWAQRLVEERVDSVEAGRRASTVLEECDRVTARINQFLAFARPSDPHVERFDPGEVLEQLALLLEPDLRAKRLTLAYHPSDASIVADREMFRQAVFNLLQNAIQASPETAAIALQMVCKADGRYRLEVADRGPGVPGECADKLFTPYFTTRPHGTGLGLAIVRRIAMAHGWEAGYSPRLGGGALFWLDGIHG